MVRPLCIQWQGCEALSKNKLIPIAFEARYLSTTCGELQPPKTVCFTQGLPVCHSCRQKPVVGSRWSGSLSEKGVFVPGGLFCGLSIAEEAQFSMATDRDIVRSGNGNQWRAASPALMKSRPPSRTTCVVHSGRPAGCFFDTLSIFSAFFSGCFPRGRYSGNSRPCSRPWIRILARALRK